MWAVDQQHPGLWALGESPGSGSLPLLRIWNLLSNKILGDSYAYESLRNTGLQKQVEGLTDNRWSAFYIFRMNQLEERSKAVISLRGGEVEEGRKDAWMRKNKQHSVSCLLNYHPHINFRSHPRLSQPTARTQLHRTAKSVELASRSAQCGR